MRKKPHLFQYTHIHITLSLCFLKREWGGVGVERAETEECGVEGDEVK